jgi:hypothetical protein
MKAIAHYASLGLLAVGAGAASAHHSYAAFDMSKSVQVTGVVKEWHWTNPHSFIVLSVTDSAGHHVDAILEANGPGYLARQGWKRDSLQKGDKITATIHPMLAGTLGGDLMAVKLPSGQVLSAELAGPRPVQAQPEAAAEEKKNEK